MALRDDWILHQKYLLYAKLSSVNVYTEVTTVNRADFYMRLAFVTEPMLFAGGRRFNYLPFL